MGITVLVCGSRGFTDRELFNKTLDELNAKTPIKTIIHGNARGADVMSWSWILKNNHGRCDEEALRCFAYNPDWDKHGKAAGIIRNKQMLVEGKPDIVVAFWDGQSTGTKNMIDIAREAGVETIIVSAPACDRSNNLPSNLSVARHEMPNTAEKYIV